MPGGAFCFALTENARIGNADVEKLLAAGGLTGSSASFTDPVTGKACTWWLCHKSEA